MHKSTPNVGRKFAQENTFRVSVILSNVNNINIIVGSSAARSRPKIELTPNRSINKSRTLRPVNRKVYIRLDAIYVCPSFMNPIYYELRTYR